MARSTHKRHDRLCKTEVATTDSAGQELSATQIVRVVAALPEATSFKLLAPAPLAYERAIDLSRALAPLGRYFSMPVSLDTLLHKTFAEESASAGCLMVEVQREGILDPVLASGLAPEAAALRSVLTGFRRARGAGLATRLKLELGRAGDDEGVFERALAFVRQALVAMPVLLPAPAQPGGLSPLTLANGLAWARARLVRHTAIWQRSLWPSGSIGLAWRSGYAERHITPRAGRYTATMDVLARLNRTLRARASAALLPAEPLNETRTATRRLQIRASADAALQALSIRLEGTLDARGARRLMKRLREAASVGYSSITIDVREVHWVSPEIFGRFLEKNRERLSELAVTTRIINLKSKLAALREQLGDSEMLRLLESTSV